MATIAQIKNRVEFYLQQSSFYQDGQDILLDELNAARRTAETDHDWKHSVEELTLSVDPTTGGALSAATGLSAGRTLKVVECFYLIGDSGDVPLYHESKRSVALVKREQLRTETWNYDTRFRADATDSSDLEATPKVFLVGETAFLEPTPSAAKSLRLDAYTWLPDYTDGADTDWFTINGADYLKWAAIVALNHFTGTFAPRQEGVIPPPVRMRDEALLRLRSLDNYFYHTGTSPVI